MAGAEAPDWRPVLSATSQLEQVIAVRSVFNIPAKGFAIHRQSSSLGGVEFGIATVETIIFDHQMISSSS
jgi:hypothetical protein